MQARFGFVQDEQARWTWRVQRRDPQQVAQGSIGKLCRFEWAQQSLLTDFDFKAPVRVSDRQRGPGECIVDRLVQRLGIADLEDGLYGCSEVRTVIAEHGRVRADLRQPCGCI